MRRNDALRNGLPGLALILVSVLPSAFSPSPSIGSPVETTSVPAIAASPQSGHPSIFFGSLHAHTKYSDGSGTPAEAFAQARDQGRLDFLAVTEHNHAKAENGIGSGDPRKDGILISTQPALYNGADAASLISTARRFTSDDTFVAIAGQEFSTISSGNHVNVFDVGKVIDVASGDFKTLYDTFLSQNSDSLNEPPLVQFNHPDFRADVENAGTPLTQKSNDYGLDDFGGDFAELVKHSERFVSLIEIVSGPALKDGVNLAVVSANRHEKDYWFYLNKGFHIAPTANQDNHFFTWGTITRARTAVMADRLTTADLLRAMKARRVYATEDENLQITFRVNGQPMGSIIRTPQPLDLTIEVELSDSDEPGAQYRVDLYRGEVGGNRIEGATEESFLEGNGKASFGGQRYESGKVFYFIKVSQTGSDGKEDFAWTAPVWIEPGQAASPPTVTQPTPDATPQPVGFVHSRKSDVYHFANCVDAARIKPENRVVSDTPPEDKTLHKNCPRVP
jgi:hypothetical protein